MADEISFEGRAIPVRPGETVAAALWDADLRSWRTTRVARAPRGLFCGIGACFDCLATVDGQLGQRLCLTEVRAGMVVTRDAGVPAASVPAAPAPAAPASPTMRRSHYDVAVIGAGPAGLAAAATAGLGGCRVVLVDSAPRPGGQFWRHREGDEVRRRNRNANVFSGLLSIVEERVDHLPGSTVWFVEPDPGVLARPTSTHFTLHTSNGPVEADRIVLATGAYDRVYPFPGWELPGVVTAGAAQALLKGSAVIVGREVVVAGAGPFLLPVAAGLAEAGARVVGVFEAGDPRRYLSRPGMLTGAAAKLGEAAGYAAALARRRIPYRVRHVLLAAHGDGRVRAVTVAQLGEDGRPLDGSVQRIECDTVAVGHGFTANLALALALGCVTRVAVDGGLAVMVGSDGRTSVPGVYAAGEVTGVGGSGLATVEGQIAGAAAAAAVGATPPLSDRGLASLRRRRTRLTSFADAMHRAHAVPGRWTDWLEEQTVICRCEEVTVETVRSVVAELGATDARSVKSLARPGMGWCQGRTCGQATAELTAGLCGRAVRRDDLVVFAARPFAEPVRLAELAELAERPEPVRLGGLPDPD